MSRTKFTEAQIKENKITYFSRDVARKLGQDIELLLLKHIGEKHSLRVAYKGGKYLAESATLRFEFIPKDLKSKEEMEYLEKARFSPMPELFQVFIDNQSGDEMMVAGLNSDNPVNCIILKRVSDGHRYKCSLEYLQEHFPHIFKKED